MLTHVPRQGPSPVLAEEADGLGANLLEGIVGLAAPPLITPLPVARRWTLFLPLLAPGTTPTATPTAVFALRRPAGEGGWWRDAALRL